MVLSVVNVPLTQAVVVFVTFAVLYSQDQCSIVDGSTIPLPMKLKPFDTMKGSVLDDET